MALLQPSDWKAEFISYRDTSPVHADRQALLLPPARQYRKEFSADKKVRRVMVYATALGIYELLINGQKVGDAFFTPGWTDYHKRAYYQAYDVTKSIKSGANAIGVTVADGWYAGYLGYGLLVGYGPNKVGRNIYGKTPAFMAQVEVEYTDGSRAMVVTDPSWKVTGEGPFREADFLMGEAYDAQREMIGWTTAGFDDRNWEPAIRAGDNGSVKAKFYDKERIRDVELGFQKPGILEVYPTEPVRITEEIKARDIIPRSNGVYIVNFGQNFAGNIRLKVKGPTGTRIKLRYGEMLHPDGRLMTENLRKARATDFYTLKGDPKGEVYVPRFTFHGFQYVEISGYPGAPTLDTLTGLVLSSDTPMTSSFECSDPMANRLFKNIVYTQRANFIELPTDCPQRDERFGWMGDAQVYVRTATYNADTAGFYNKWLREVKEAQLPEGAYPDYCPWPMKHGKAFAPAWTDAGIIVPWTIYQVYGDTRVIERQWDSMKKFMNWRESVNTNYLGIVHGNEWGDWLSLSEKTPIDYIDTVYYAYDAKLMSQMAGAIGKSSEGDYYNHLFGRIKEAFASKYLKPDGTLTVDTQTAYVIALFTGLVPDQLRVNAGNRLAEKIRKDDTRMGTGFVGTRPLLPVLTSVGQHDLATVLFQSRKYPSWGYEVDNGATSIWERWNSYTKDKGFGGDQNAQMNSFSHYSFGAVCEWMFQSLAGIDTDGPGFRKLILHPLPPGTMSNPDRAPVRWVRAHYDSHQGRIDSAWKWEGGQFELNVTIPANVTATVYVPTSDAAKVMESGKLLGRTKGIKILSNRDELMVLEVGSGKYEFTAPWNK
jgi:alpha-L-rhamnosidase